MSVMNAYMIISTNLHKDNPFKPPKQYYTHRAKSNMQKDNIYYMKRQRGNDTYDR